LKKAAGLAGSRFQAEAAIGRKGLGNRPQARIELPGSICVYSAPIKRRKVDRSEDSGAT
jgi:hypothetical protein